MKVINIYAGPGAGKTTQGLDITAYMKKKGYSVELIPEYAKKLIYQGREHELRSNQIGVFSNQLEPYRYLDGKVDYVIAECPLLLSVVYNRIGNVEDNPYFDDFVMHEHNRFDNINIYLRRETVYKTEGRYQDEKGAIEVDNMTVSFLEEQNVDYTEIGLERFCQKVVNIVEMGSNIDK